MLHTQNIMILTNKGVWKNKDEDMLKAKRKNFLVVILGIYTGEAGGELSTGPRYREFP